MSNQTYAVFIDGLSGQDEIAALPDHVRQSAIYAVKRATEKAKTESNRRMREQIHWAARYLDGKLDIRISDDKLEGRIDALFRPTSLARFVVGGAQSKTKFKPGLTLHVGEGSFTKSQRMMIVPLKYGNYDITEGGPQNLGLAIRLKEGETISGKYKVKEMSRGLYLLYGPSAAQVFYTVAEDILPDVSEWLDDEFVRQMNRLGDKK